LKPHLLIILNRLVVGGHVIDTLPLANALIDQYEILVVYGEKEKDEQDFSSVIDSSNIAFQKIHSLRRSVNPLNDVVAVIDLHRIIKKFKPVIVHTHGSKPGVNGRIAAWLANVPVIIHTFHGHLFHSYYNKFVSLAIIKLERILGNISSKIIVLGEQQRKEICEVYKIATQDKTKLIPLGVDEHLYSENVETLRSDFRSKHHLTQEITAIGIIGRIVPIKNHKLFAEVVIKLTRSSVGEKIKFFVVGDGYSKKSIQNILANAGIAWSNNDYDKEAKVIFTSWVTPVAKVLHGLDIVVLTSLNEGTPLSLIEAQVCAKPVVASNVGGVKDTFLNNESGFLIEDHDINAFMNKITMLVEEPERRKKMGCIGQSFAKKKFSKQAEINAFRELYASCINEL
jgi:glycosyltransferase involved in cell wall biosynthesis